MLGTCVANITGASLTSYTVTGLSPQTAYYFTVQVVDMGEKSTNSNQVAVTPVGGRSFGGEIVPIDKVSLITPSVALTLMACVVFIVASRKFGKRKRN
jgi:hypothetical protein